MPDFSIVDAHVHLIDPNHVPLSWGHEAPSLNKRHLTSDFDAACGMIDIEAIVFVEVDVVEGRHLDEVAMVEGMAVADPRISAIVAHVPLEKGDEALADLEILSARPLVRGVRRLIQNEVDPQWCLNPGFVRGVQHLANYGLHFEICIKHPQAQAALELVRLCPNTQFVLDHIGKPGIRDGLMDPWRAHIRAMAGLPNVVCKLSGLVTEADHANWQPHDLMPYIEHVVECFGFDRLIFGSDWPVLTLASEYSKWLETLDAALAGTNVRDMEKLYRDNAKSFYRMNR